VRRLQKRTGDKTNARHLRHAVMIQRMIQRDALRMVKNPPPDPAPVCVCLCVCGGPGGRGG